MKEAHISIIQLGINVCLLVLIDLGVVMTTAGTATRARMTVTVTEMMMVWQVGVVEWEVGWAVTEEEVE